MKLLWIALLVYFFDIAQQTNVNSCSDGSTTPEVQFYLTSGEVCDEQPCIVVPGGDIYMHVFFKSPGYLENIKPDMKASSLGVSLDYPLFQDNACDGIINTVCPLVKNETVEYYYKMSLLDVFPEVTVTLTFTIIDEDTSTNVVCFIVDIKIKRP
ncbi:hypothetical protein NQ317_009266 [Molorchus minor]|uniref:MD-2-related lipid-recognition domain-containing protein n=1 Tax=Molorchus minor TaxID=1323400 RepID=A0ABQ9IRR8_9CUCU|nr:hypothetical protein NQ317_009266 [Molorchus minor]